MEEGSVFMSMSVTTPLLCWSVVLFLTAGYCLPKTDQVTLQLLMSQDNMCRYSVRSVLVFYLPLLILSTATYHTKFSTSKISSLSSRVVSIVRAARTGIALLETCALAAYAVVTPLENLDISDGAIRHLISLHTVNTILTTVLVKCCLPSTRYKRISLFLKISLILTSIFLHKISLPLFCAPSSSSCLMHQGLFLPLFSVFHGSSCLDIGDKRVVIRHRNVKEFERNVLEAKQIRAMGGRVADVEYADF